ncbi:MAG: hypothetical protein IKQ60_07670 [Candidatus Methanomethylophilaceae archaeon]|nr:hypothetical protein [Candidatus Methanomethylophilaceae archaeon]
MEYDLMHKDTRVLQMSLDEESGLIGSIERVYSIEHLPVGTFQDGLMNGNDLRKWWARRSIPASRSGIGDVLYSLDIPCATALLPGCVGLSLSDQYWIRASGTEAHWKDVNFFDNGFSEDLGDLMFGKTVESDMDLNTPDSTTDGVLKKRWKIIGGKRFLIKAGAGTAMQEPFNEAVASLLMDILDVPHVPYSVVWSDGRPYSVCPDFVDRSTELVSAYSFMNSYSRRTDAPYDRYVDGCRGLGIDVVPALDRMMAVDFLMANGDRHLNNFGLIRDADTLELLGPAPIYDSGSSFGHDLLTKEIPSKMGESCKPFKNTFPEQMGLVSDFGWIDFDALRDALPGIKAILSAEGFLDAARVEALTHLMDSRISALERIAGGTAR